MRERIIHACAVFAMAAIAFIWTVRAGVEGVLAVWFPLIAGARVDPVMLLAQVAWLVATTYFVSKAIK